MINCFKLNPTNNTSSMWSFRSNSKGPSERRGSSSPRAGDSESCGFATISTTHATDSPTAASPMVVPSRVPRLLWEGTHEEITPTKCVHSHRGSNHDNVHNAINTCGHNHFHCLLLYHHCLLPDLNHRDSPGGGTGDGTPVGDPIENYLHIKWCDERTSSLLNSTAPYVWRKAQTFGWSTPPSTVSTYLHWVRNQLNLCGYRCPYLLSYLKKRFIVGDVRKHH